MIRRVAFAAILFAAAAGPALAGQVVALRSQPSAGAAGVTLGDLFEGVTGPAARVVVAGAPAAGANTVLDAGKIQLAARQAGLDWDNTLGQRRIIVSGQGVAAPTAQPAQRSAQVLAYARNIMAGEIVQAADLTWSEAAVAPAGAPGDPDAVIGMAARRPLRAGAAATVRDVAAPVVVKRDEIIQVAFETGGISLILQARAMKDAAVGDSLQVLNLQSKKVIEAVVAGPGRAVVGPAAQALRSSAFATASLR